MKNKKIIALVCALSMIFSVFASFTVVRADGAKQGIILSTEMSKDYKTATITVQYGEDFYDEGIAGAQVNLNLPADATITYTKPLDLTYAGGAIDANDGIWKLMVYSSDAAVKADDHIITVITVQLTDSLSKDAAVALQKGSNISNDSLTLQYDDNNNSLDVTTTTITADPDKATEEPEDKATYDDNTDDLYDEVEVGANGGIALALNKVSDTKYEIVVTYSGTEFETNGIAGAQVNLNLPTDATITYTKPLDLTYAGGAVDANDGIWKLMVYSSDAAVKADDKVITVITVEYPSGGYAEDHIVALQTGSNISNDNATLQYDATHEDLNAVTVVLPASVAPDKEIALSDAIDDTKAKLADEDETLDDAYLAVKATTEDGSPAKYGADKDYVAYYDGNQLTEDQMNKLLAGDYDGVSLEDAVKGITFKYNNGVNLAFQLVTEKDGEKTVADSGDNADVTPVTPGRDLSADGKIASKVSKSIKSNASKQTATFTVTPAKDKDGNVIVSDEPHVTITVKKSSYDAITGSGIEVAYTDYEIEDTDNDDDYEEAAVKTKTYYVYPSIQEADTEITLPDALDYKYEVSFTPAAKGTVEYTMTYYDANGKKAEATAKYTISEASTKSSSSGSSSDSKSSGGGAIATGLVDTGAGYLPSLGFDDLGDVEWAQTAINSLAAKKIVSGVGDNKFDPNAALTRAAYAQMLVNAIGHSQDSADVEFADVPTDSWFYHNVAVAAQLGIVSGYGDGNFGPYDLITREQMALMTQKAAVVMGNSLIGADNGTFTDDADIADWAHDAVYTLSNAGIINGMGDGTFAPKANATRAQAAVIIYNTFVK